MKITYDGKMYYIITEYPETEIHIGTDNIAEAKKFYVEHLMKIFDDTVRSKFWEEKLHLF